MDPEPRQEVQMDKQHVDRQTAAEGTPSASGSQGMLMTKGQLAGGIR